MKDKHYKGYIIILNPDNIYNYKPATYIYYRDEDTDGKVGWGETVQECKDFIDDEIY